MVKYFLPLLLVISLIIAGCTDKSDVVSPEKNGGSVVLSIDKENAPAGIVTVSASLTRQGYSPIVKGMNLLTDSSAALNMDNIPVGQWHLKVEAKDEASVVKYMGEKDVVISDGIITQISLTLMPTSTGMGGILIKVTWGTTTVKKWTDYSGNPVLFSTGSTWDQYGTHMPKIIYSNGKYEMWFGNLTDAGRSYVSYAVSDDGNTWSRPYMGPVLLPGPDSSWDGGKADIGPVVKENGVYYMLYLGWQYSGGPSSIGLAISTNGYKWEKNYQPVLTALPDESLGATAVIKIKNLYYMYYNYRFGNGNDWKVGLATSTDLINWKRYSNNPILQADKAWEGPGLGNASIIKESDSKYLMFYSNTAASTITGFGIAESNDGIHWTKRADNPFFTSTNSTIKWSIDKVLYPNCIKTETEYRIYYTGYKTGITSFRIGYAKLSLN